LSREEKSKGQDFTLSCRHGGTDIASGSRSPKFLYRSHDLFSHSCDNVMTEKEAPSFEILHFSVRYPKRITDPPKYPYFIHNLVWRAHDKEFKNVCEGMVDDWRETEIVFDKKLAEEYLDGLDFVMGKVDNQFGYAPCDIVHRGGMRRDTVFHRGWQRQFPFVFYIEKFDCFRTWGFTESNAITRACAHELEMLKLNENMYSGRFATWSHFRRIIECLDSFWD
jgi:hypothetical protein